jgi:hypothetical protein
MQDPDRTASLMTPAKLAQVKPGAAASPAAWLDQMAADAGHAHVRRLAQLGDELAALGAADGDFSRVAACLARLGQALPLLDFGLLQPRGWLARVTGKGRGAGAGFTAQVEQIDDAINDLAAQAQALRKKQQERAAANDRTLMELEVEFRAIDTIINQGARWLQDMRGQLKVRQQEQADEPARRQIADDAARCEMLVARLKLLRAASSAAQQTLQQARETGSRRVGLLQMLQQALAADVKEWRTRISPLAASVESGSLALSLEVPMEGHRDLQLCIKQAVADCAQLQAQEQALAGQLGTLAGELRAAS